MNPGTGLLKVNSLSIGYQSKKERSVVSKNINFSLRKGELVGLVGANGIGKSTLIRTLSNLQPSLSGEMLLYEKSILSYSSLELAQQLSLVLTEQMASKTLTVYETIALGRQPYTNWIGKLSKKDMVQIELAMELTNIKHLKNQYCHELSDGQLQIVMIARALAQQTDLIILDEPTTHLDLYHKAQILKLLKDLAQNHSKALLFSSHEINLCIQLCDRLIVMSEDTVIIDTPCHLIEAGVFDVLFSDEFIAFDASKGVFRIKP